MGKPIEKLQAKLEENKDKALICIAFPCIVMGIIFILTLLFPKMYGTATIVLHILLWMSTAILFGLFHSAIEEGKRTKYIKLVKLGLWQMVLYIITLFWWSIGKKIGSESIASISGIFFFISSAGFGLIVTNEKVSAWFEHLQGYNLLSGISVERKFTPGDVVLCNVFEDVEAGVKDSREILLNKDRFLHMLILGATGTGKTSQVLIPMIHQDVQNPEAGVIVLEPKGDLAQKVKFMAKHYGRDAFYFDPAMSDCPYFNPLSGREIDVIENMATTFRMLNPDSPTFFLDLSEQLVRNAVKVLKRMDRMDKTMPTDYYSTLNQLSTLLQNVALGGKMIDEFAKLCKANKHSMAPSEAKENEEIVVYFQADYYQEKSKTYENTSGVRSQVSKICSNEFLRDVLNPDPTQPRKDRDGNEILAADGKPIMQCNDIDFDKALAEGQVLCLSTAQGTLRDLSRFLGLFVILQLQSAVFRRPGNEDTRRSNFLYIDEFQVFATPGFADMLTMGRSYRVASHLATQARAQMAMGGGKDGDNFVTLVSTNARNVILFPGCSYDDAKYYSDQFGEKEECEVQVGISRKKFDIFTGGFDSLGHPTESIRETKKLVPVFTPTELIYREFGDIVYCIIKNNSIQIPRIGKITYIPREVNTKLDKEILAYLAEFTKKTEDELREIREREAAEKVSRITEEISFDDECDDSQFVKPLSKKPELAHNSDNKFIDLSEEWTMEEARDQESDFKSVKESDVNDCLGDLGKVMEDLDLDFSGQRSAPSVTSEDDEELEEFDV